jgi:hypothetical protein
VKIIIGEDAKRASEAANALSLSLTEKLADGFDLCVRAGMQTDVALNVIAISGLGSTLNALRGLCGDVSNVGEMRAQFPAKFCQSDFEALHVFQIGYVTQVGLQLIEVLDYLLGLETRVHERRPDGSLHPVAHN